MSLIPADVFQNLANYCRNYIINAYNPTSSLAEPSGLRTSLMTKHKGLYVGIFSPKDEEICSEGILKEDLTDILDTGNLVCRKIFDALRAKNITESVFKTCQCNFALVKDIIYIMDSLDWNQAIDGIYMQWGQKYKGIYLPYQIKRMKVTKNVVMDRLCSWQCGIVSSCWKMPEGLTYKVVCDSLSL